MWRVFLSLTLVLQLTTVYIVPNVVEQLNNSVKSVGNTVKYVLLGIVGIWILTSIFVAIPVGQVGVLYDLGRGALDNHLNPGLHIVIPIWQKVTLINTRIQEYTMSVSPTEGARKGDDSIDAPTADGQQVKLDATVLFYVDPAKAPSVWKTVGTDYLEKIVRPIVRSEIRKVAGQYSALGIYAENRGDAERAINDEVKKFLAEKNISLDRVLLRGVYFSPEYAKAIEAKQIAEQRVKQAGFETEEAKKRSEAKVFEAEGLAKAQALQKASLTQEYLQLEAIKKWDGKLPQVSGGTAPFINIPLK